MLFKKQDKHLWNVIFPILSDSNNELARKMAHDCIDFSDALLNSDIFIYQNYAARCECIVFFKVWLYNTTTEDPILHSLVFGYICDYIIRFYKETIDYAESLYKKMVNDESFYRLLMHSSAPNERMVAAMKQFYNRTKKITDTDGNKIIECDFDNFSQVAGQNLAIRHSWYMNNR